MPLRQLDRDALGTGEEDQLSVVEIHDLVAGGETGRGHLGERRRHILHREADVVQAELAEIANLGIRRAARRAKVAPEMTTEIASLKPSSPKKRFASATSFTTMVR